MKVKVKMKMKMKVKINKKMKMKISSLVEDESIEDASIKDEIKIKVNAFAKG